MYCHRLGRLYGMAQTPKLSAGAAPQRVVGQLQCGLMALFEVMLYLSLSSLYV